MLDGSARRRVTSQLVGLVAGLAICLSLLAAALLPSTARAQNEWGASYITPFPEDDVYRLKVFGDAMAEGVFGALTEAFRSDSRVRLPNSYDRVNGFIRMRPEDFARFEESIKKEPLHIAVIMLGTSDRVALRAPDGRRVNVGSDEWKEEYGRRVDRITRALKRRGAAVYWVGLPIVSRSDMNEDVRMLNSVFRERALLNGIKFIDIYEAFADELGQYTQYGPDLTGKQRLLRSGDGIYFTTVGYRKVAYFVEREIKRDLIQAKNERDIPLAGSEAEQRRISPKAQADEWAGTVQRAPQEGENSAAAKASASAPQNSDSGSGALKAENSKVAIKIAGASGKEEAVTIEILRPAIPESIVALVSRQHSQGHSAQIGDNIPETLPGGVTVLSSITPGLAAGSQAQRRRLAPTQSPFFKVLVKGERIPPKPGRADDFTWPPPDSAPPPRIERRSQSSPIPLPKRNPQAAEAQPSHG